MIGHVLSDRLIPFNATFKSNGWDKKSFNPKLKEETEDTFEKSKKDDPSNFLLAFTGKIDKNAVKMAKTFFTKGDNLFVKALNDLQDGIKGGKNELVNSSIEKFNKAMTNFEKSLKWFKPVIPEEEFADKASYIGVKYTDLGNITQNPLCYQRAYQLFDEASEIAQTKLYLEQQKTMTMMQNKEVLDQILHPQPAKNPIGFYTEDQLTAMKNSGSTSVPKKEKIGFVDTDKKVS